MKKLKYLILILSVLLLSSFTFVGVNKVYANETKEIVNNVVFLSFKNGNDSWLNNIPSNYTKNYYTLFDNAYNNSVASVNAYYKTMSFNSLNLTSNFYFADSTNKTAIEIPFTEKELKCYTSSNPEGYYEIAVIYSPSGNIANSDSNIVFSCYDCSKAPNRNKHDTTDSNRDGVYCKCAALEYQNSNENIYVKDHYEKTFRKQISLRYAFKQISSLSGNLDSMNSDGYIDAVSFIFPKTSGVYWSDLLWPQSSQDTTLFVGGWTDASVLDFCERMGCRGITTEYVSLLKNAVTKNGKTFKRYNLYTALDLVNIYGLTDANGLEMAISYTLAHELGHNLGLPDLYTYNYDNSTGFNSESGEAFEYLDLMCNSTDEFPLYMSSYHREILGFTNEYNIKTLDTEGTYTLKPVNYDEINNSNNNSNNVLAYVLEDPNYEGQKIYIEYRGPKSTFDTHYNLTKSGLIIYRVDENVTSNYGEYSLSVGNYLGYPYQMCLYKTSSGTIIFNDSNNRFGNSTTTSTTNAITFQTYGSETDQGILTKADVTFNNTGIVIKNISINTETNEISFYISGGHLKEPIDLSSVTLNGNEEVEIEVLNNYLDAGINFGNFSLTDFSIETTSNIDINALGTFTYTYKLTHIATHSTKTLIRTVKVVDTTAPTVTLIGNEEIVLSNLDFYVEQGINYSDNYTNKTSLIVKISNPIFDSSLNRYLISYIVKDSSGNETTIYRYIQIIPDKFKDITLLGESEINIEYGSNYSEPLNAIDFGNYNKAEFQVIISNNLNLNILGEYYFTYTLKFLETNETFVLTRTVNVVDTIAPEITLIGESFLSMYPSEYANFIDAGYIAIDNYDSNPIVTSNVLNDGNFIYITYIATDNSNNINEVTRTINLIYIDLKSSQIGLKINGSSSLNTCNINNTIKIAVDIKLGEDNNPTNEIEIFINNNKIDNGISNKEYNVFMSSNGIAQIEFKQEGQYYINIVVGNANIQKTIKITDPNKLLKEDKQIAISALIAIFSVIIISSVILAIVKNKASKIKNRLDRY